MAEKTLTYGVEIPVDTNALEGANSVDTLRKSVLASQNAVKEYGAALRNLKGDTEAVKGAKEKLKAAIAANKDNLSKATTALVAQGVSLKGAKEKADGFATSLAKKLVPSLKDWNGAQMALAGGAAALVAAMVAVTAAIGGAAIALGKFILESANALRTQGLFREAATGSAANAEAFGHQIEALALKVPQSRAELNELSVTMSRLLVDTRVSGEGIVDTFNAVAQASAAMGDSAGAKIQGLVDRAKQWGRFSLGMFELQGTGLNFQDVAGQLAKDLHIGLKDAQNELFMGRVNVNAGAKALREVVETKFGGINLRRMLDLNVISTKVKDALAGMTRDVNLQPLLTAFQKLAGLFSETSVTGTTLKNIVTDFGNGMVKIFEVATPYVKTFVEAFVLEMLKFENSALKAMVFVKEKWGVNLSKTFEDTSFAATLAKTAFRGLEAAVFGTVAAGALLIGPFVAVGAGVMWVVHQVRDAIHDIKEAFTLGDWQDIGLFITNGIVSGLQKGAKALWEAVKGIGQGIKDAFTGKLEIKSPSKVFERYGDSIAQGTAEGVRGGSGSVQAAADAMAPAPSIKLGGGGGGGSGGPISINVNIHVNGGGNAAQALTAPSFKAQLTKLLEEAAINAGLRPQGA